MIFEELSKDTIFLSIDAKNTDEIFEKLGGNLVDLGIAKETYVDALKEREKNFPTGIIINEDGLALALPHTSVDYVNKSAISIATLKNPVKFNVMGGAEDEFCSVNIVFMLAVDDPNAHLEQLQRIVQIFQDSQFLEDLTNADNPEKVIDIFKIKEESLCQKK